MCGCVVVNGCGSFREESLPDVPPHLVIKEHTDNTKPLILHFFWKHTSIELKRSVSYMFKKKLVSIATCGNNREASCLNQESDGQVQGKTSVITTHLW